MFALIQRCKIFELFTIKAVHLSKIMMSRKKTLLILLLLYPLSITALGQSNCNEIEFLMTDFKSEDVLIVGSKEFMFKKMGKPLSINIDNDYLIWDSISNVNGRLKRSYSHISVEFINYNGVQYIGYNDSVQVSVIDFFKTNYVVFLGNVELSNCLDLDTFLQKFGIDKSCVNITFDGFYGSDKNVYHFGFYSKISPSWFNFFFDYNTRKLWYIDFGVKKTGGIIR